MFLYKYANYLKQKKQIPFTTVFIFSLVDVLSLDQDSSTGLIYREEKSVW